SSRGLSLRPGRLVRQGREALLDPLRRDAGQARQLGARLGLSLHDAPDDRRALAVLGLAGEFEPDAVRVVEVDAEQPRYLRERPDVVDAARLEPRLDLAEPVGRDGEGAVLHRADRVAVAGRLLAFR